MSGPDSLSPLSLSSLADWETYGLSLSPPQPLQPSPEGIMGFAMLRFCIVRLWQRTSTCAVVFTVYLTVK